MAIIRFKLNPSPKVISGLFCRLKIPGRTIQDSYEVPISAVDENNFIFIEIGGKLDRVKVKVLHQFENHCIISTTFPVNSKIIISKIPSPIIGMKIKAIKNAQ